MISGEINSGSAADKRSIQNKMTKIQREFKIQKAEAKKLKSEIAIGSNKDDLFGNMEDPLLDNKFNRVGAMNDKLMTANRQGYEAEIYGNNIEAELMRNDNQFDAIGRTVSIS